MHDAMRALSKPERGSLALLLLALSAALVFSDPGRFHRWNSDHAGITLDHMQVALNRSPAHGFLGFDFQLLNAAGEATYQPYNRFPIAGSLLIKAVTLPFADDLAAQIHAARWLMLAFFAAAVVLAYLGLKRLAACPTVALAATVLAFSSFWTLHYADMVATEGPMDLFAVMLVFHALVVFVQGGRFLQLLAKTGAALLIGWHVFALLLPFVVLGLAVERRRGGGAARLPRGRLVVLGAVALSFGLSVLALNVALEYSALAEASPAAQGRKTTLADLPTLQALSRRLGWRADPVPGHAPPLPLLQTLFERAGRAVLPYAGEHVVRSWLGAPDGALEGGVRTSSAKPPPAGGVKLDAAVLWGGVACLVCLVGLAFMRHRVLLAALASSGFCWGLLAPGSVPQHAFEGMFHVGLALVFFFTVLAGAQALLSARPLFSTRLMAAGAGGALLIFVISSQQMGRLDVDRVQPGFRELVADMQRIRAIAPPGAVVVPSAAQPGVTAYLLAGRVLLSPLNGRQRHRADFVLSRERAPGPGTGLLTPENRYLFLYDRREYDTRYATLGEPAFRGSGWSIHVVGNRLLYTTGKTCPASSMEHEPPLFLEIASSYGAPRRRSMPVPRFKFAFRDSGFEVAGRCVAEFALWSHNAAVVRTGQLRADDHALWSEELTVNWPRLRPRWPVLARPTDRLLLPAEYRRERGPATLPTPWPSLRSRSL